MSRDDFNLYDTAHGALRLAQLVASPDRRELLLSLIREAHGDPSAAIDPRPSLPTVSPDPAAGAAVPSPAEAVPQNDTDIDSP